MDPNGMEEDDVDDQLVGAEGEEDLSSSAEDDEALASPHAVSPVALNLSPPPPYLREISTLASWTVSSSKPGCSIPQLRDPSPNLFWQSDGPQPHYLNIHFFKLVRIVGLRLYLDFEQDESYTPTRIVFLAGSGMNDLVEWGEMRLESPRGWVWADFSGVGDPDSDDEDGDAEEGGEGGASRLTLDPPVVNENGTQAHDASSDSENIPQQRRTRDDAMLVDPQQHQQQTPQLPQQQQQQQQQHQQTPQQHAHDLRHSSTHPHPPNGTPNSILPTPSLNPARPSRRRTPFTPLPPNAPATQLAAAPRRPKMPVLRAHVVQIKILENHQNGKDTHLRGLQVFARNDEVESVVARKGQLGHVGGGKSRRRERFDELGGGFGEGGGIR